MVFSIGLLFAILLFLNGLIRLTSQIASADTEYAVDYAIKSDWGSGALVVVTIKNSGSSDINNWKLGWTFPGNQKLSNLWNGNYIQAGSSVTVSNLARNATIPAKSKVSFGFNLSYTGSNAKPTRFILNNHVIASPSLGLAPTPSSAATSTPTANCGLDSGAAVLCIGRFDTSDSAGPKFAWSASTIKANFEGTNISVNLKSADENWFNVVIDGEVKTPVCVGPGTAMPVLLAAGLTSGTHTIELIKRTEAFCGDVQFLGFHVEDGILLPPPAAAARRIELIGDSITCGYGNEGTNPSQYFALKNENAFLAYGSLTARALNADQITIAWSGKGIVHNYGGDTSEMMPQIYSRILPYQSALTWDSSQWIPGVVVINLGTNDFNPNPPDKTIFIATYSGFVKKIRNQYRNAHIYCALGPMLSGERLTSARECLTAVVEQFNSAGDAAVHFIEFPMHDGCLGYGEAGYPSVATHARMAKQLVKQIKTDLGW